MNNMKLKRAIGLVILLALAPIHRAQAIGVKREPDLPTPLCDSLRVPPGNKVAFHVYALGVQVYRWNGTSWGFVAPVANLFADDNYRGQVGTHYVGPTWESNSGSKVVATRLQSCSPDTTAIPWLLLQTVANDGPGIFSSVTYVQRVNTAGGLAPTAPGSYVGVEMKVPYTAEYYFYRPEN